MLVAVVYLFEKFIQKRQLLLKRFRLTVPRKEDSHYHGMF